MGRGAEVKESQKTCVVGKKNVRFLEWRKREEGGEKGRERGRERKRQKTKERDRERKKGREGMA